MWSILCAYNIHNETNKRTKRMSEWERIDGTRSENHDMKMVKRKLYIWRCSRAHRVKATNAISEHSWWLLLSDNISRVWERASGRERDVGRASAKFTKNSYQKIWIWWQNYCLSKVCLYLILPSCAIRLGCFVVISKINTWDENFDIGDGGGGWTDESVALGWSLGLLVDALVFSCMRQIITSNGATGN